MSRFTCVFSYPLLVMVVSYDWEKVCSQLQTHWFLEKCANFLWRRYSNCLTYLIRRNCRNPMKSCCFGNPAKKVLLLGSCKIYLSLIDWPVQKRILCYCQDLQKNTIMSVWLRWKLCPLRVAVLNNGSLRVSKGNKFNYFRLSGRVAVAAYATVPAYLTAWDEIHQFY